MIDLALAFKSHMNEGIVLCFGSDYDQKIYHDFDFGSDSGDKRSAEMVRISYFVVEFLITRFGMTHKVIANNVLAYSKRGYHRMNERYSTQAFGPDKDRFFKTLDTRLDDIIKKIMKGRPLITVDECRG